MRRNRNPLGGVGQLRIETGQVKRWGSCSVRGDLSRTRLLDIPDCWNDKHLSVDFSRRDDKLR